MRFNSVAYDKVFPRETPVVKPESMVMNFHSNDAPNEKTVETSNEESNNNDAAMEGGESNGAGNGSESATE